MCTDKLHGQKQGLVTPVKAHETAVVESGRKYKPRKRRKSEKALAAESQSCGLVFIFSAHN